MDNIYIVNQVTQLPDLSQIETLKSAIHSDLPEGYQEFIMQYGGGELNSFLYLLAPDEILKATAEWHDTLVSDFWDEDAGLSQELREESYVLAYSIDSDLIVFHPEKEELFCLPQQDSQIFSVGNTLSEMIEWVFQSEELFEVRDGLFYKPDGATSMVRYRNSDPPDFDSFKNALEVLGPPDYSVETDQFVDIFFKKWGAHINYGPEYDQLIVTCDAGQISSFLAVWSELISKKGFAISEKMNVPD